MKKILLVITLILLLSGCESSIDLDNYYYTKAKLEGYELKCETLTREEIILNDTIAYYEKNETITEIAYNEIKLKIVYQFEYKDEYIFSPVSEYWYCNSGDCNIVDEEYYFNIG